MCLKKHQDWPLLFISHQNEVFLIVDNRMTSNQQNEDKNSSRKFLRFNYCEKSLNFEPKIFLTMSLVRSSILFKDERGKRLFLHAPEKIKPQF
jgi:hypothetical protein